MTDPAAQITQILRDLNDGDPRAADRMLPLIYDELRALAGSFFARQSPDHTLQPTALVHEAYMRLAQAANPDWNGRAHFFAVAAKAMRQILMNHARAQNAAKRGGNWRRMSLDEAVTPPGVSQDLDLLALDDALTELATLAPRQARVVELRFFAGMSIRETAAALGLGTTTVEDDWTAARTWLGRQLAAGPDA